MVRKKILTLVVMSLSVVMLLGVFTANAAGNYEDTNYYVSFKTSSEAQYTSTRQKKDNTSSYMKCTYCTGTYSYKIRAYGVKSQDARDGRYDCSGGHEYTIKNGSTCYLTNYINEKGYPYGCIQLKSTLTGFDTYGKWSPDSI